MMPSKKHLKKMISKILSELKEAFTLDFRKKCRWCRERFEDGKGFSNSLCSRRCARLELIEML